MKGMIVCLAREVLIDNLKLITNLSNICVINKF